VPLRQPRRLHHRIHGHRAGCIAFARPRLESPRVYARVWRSRSPHALSDLPAPSVYHFLSRPHIDLIVSMTKMSSAEGVNDRSPQVSTTPRSIMISRYALQAAAFGVFAGSSRCRQPEQVNRPRRSTRRSARKPQPPVSQMGKTLLTKELSFSGETIRVYQDEAGQPLHIFHAMNVVARRPDRLAAHVTGDDGSHDLIYDGKSVAVSSSNRNEYVVVPATGDIPSALETVQELNPDFPLVDFFTEAPDKSFLSGVTAGWQVGTNKLTASSAGICFSPKGVGVDLELWVEKNDAAIPHRLIVTYRMVPGAPNFYRGIRELERPRASVPVKSRVISDPLRGSFRVQY